MSQLFDNYTTKKSVQLPDNTSQILEMKPTYDEVIVLGADNTHCFTIPHRREQVSDLKIVYNQGIETKVVKEYHVLLDEDGGPTYVTDEDGKKTYQLADIPSGAIHWDYSGDSQNYYSLISFDITEEETKLFNWYNQDTDVQIFITLFNGHFKSQEDPYDPGNEGTTDNDFNGTLDQYDNTIIDPLDILETYFDGEVDPVKDDPFIYDGGPCNYDVSDIYVIKIVPKLENNLQKEGE